MEKEIEEKMKALFSNSLEIKEGKFIYHDIEFSCSEDFINNYNCIKYNLNRKLSIESENKVEYLMKSDRHYLFRDKLVEDVNFTIIINEVSEELLTKLFILYPNERVGSYMLSFRFREYFRVLSKEKELDIYDLLREVFKEYESIVITKKNNDRSLKNSLIMIKSCIFNLSMLKGKNCYLIDSVDEIIKSKKRSSEIRVTKSNVDVDVPHLKYNEYLVEYYLSGNSANVPLVKFLSFYNVIEYYFELVFIDDRSKKIQKIITSPKFHHNNLDDYKEILNSLNIKRAKQLNNNSFDEKESFKLVLMEVIKEDEFKEFIKENEFYIDFNAYKLSNTKFSLEDNLDHIIAKIVNRVYSVRNALVHSKEGNDVVYVPGRDDSYIVQEIPLVKYISEKVIISKATVIKY